MSAKQIIQQAINNKSICVGPLGEEIVNGIAVLRQWQYRDLYTIDCLLKLLPPDVDSYIALANRNVSGRCMLMLPLIYITAEQTNEYRNGYIAGIYDIGNKTMLKVGERAVCQPKTTYETFWQST